MRSLHPLKSVLIVMFLLSGLEASALCTFSVAPGRPQAKNGDVLFKLLTKQASCPANVFQLHSLLEQSGYEVMKSLVSNQGFHSPSSSYSLFEWVTGKGTAGELVAGDLFLGHFTGNRGDKLVATQSPSQGLMIELELRDPTKDGAYNFYELVGRGGAPQWFYRGDSFDIYTDLKKLHLNAAGDPSFGQTLRCSGCHLSGGPIMKELATPHSDWLTEARPLSLKAWTFDAALGAMLSKTPKEASESLPSAVSDAESLAALVRETSSQLVHSEPLNLKRKASQTLPEQLRPLFCPMELNLESSQSPLNETGKGPDIDVPTAFFTDVRLAKAQVILPRAAYLEALRKLGSRFEGTDPVLMDGDHAWMTPVKSNYDQEAVAELVAKGRISEPFVVSVLSIDFTNPVFSKSRCRLLPLVPLAETSDWQTKFQEALGKSPLPQAKTLAALLVAPDVKPKDTAKAFLDQCQKRYQKPEAVASLVDLLFQRRAEAFQSDISTNRAGQILEPGFRIIFPEIPEAPTPGKLGLDPVTCEVKAN